MKLFQEISESFNDFEVMEEAVKVCMYWNSAIKHVDNLLQKEILPFSLCYDQPSGNIDTSLP